MQKDTRMINNTITTFVRIAKTTGWVDRVLSGSEGTAAGLLEECVLDDDDGKCEKFSNALDNLTKLLGVGAGEQY